MTSIGSCGRILPPASPIYAGERLQSLLIMGIANDSLSANGYQLISGGWISFPCHYSYKEHDPSTNKFKSIIHRRALAEHHRHH